MPRTAADAIRYTINEARTGQSSIRRDAHVFVVTTADVFGAVHGMVNRIDADGMELVRIGAETDVITVPWSTVAGEVTLLA